MKKYIPLLLFVSLACSSVRIKDIDKVDAFALSKYKSFGFFEVDAGGDALGPNYASNLELLKKGVIKQLEAKGVVSQSDNPDLLVNIGIVVTQEVQTRETSFTNPVDRTAYMGQRNYSWHAQEVEVGKYRQGTVTIHLVDRASNKLVWKGSADSVVPEKEKNVPALIEEGMEKLFAKLQ